MSIEEVVMEAARKTKIDKVTLRKLELLSLPEVRPLTPSQIKSLRSKYKLSQGVMAALLNVGTTTIQKWERGETSPGGPALKLLNLVEAKGPDAIA